METAALVTRVTLIASMCELAPAQGSSNADKLYEAAAAAREAIQAERQRLDRDEAQLEAAIRHARKALGQPAQEPRLHTPWKPC